MNKNLISSNQNRDLNPFSMFKDELWDVFERFSRDLDLPLKSGEEFIPKIEVKDEENSYLVRAEVPGMEEKDINLSLKDNNLIIEGEKRKESKNEDKKKGTYHSEFSYGRFYRAIPLAEDVDVEKISASYKDGVLKVEVAKNPEKSNRARKIEIKSTKSDQQQKETRH